MYFKLTNNDQATLKKFQRNVYDRSSYIKVTTLILLDKSLDISKISDYLGIDDSTIYRYLYSYQTDGLSIYLQTDKAIRVAYLVFLLRKQKNILLKKMQSSIPKEV